MAIREILLLGNPVLRKRCVAIKNFRDPSVRKTIADLSDTLKDFRSRHGFGRGIAAPQIDVSRRIIVVMLDKPTPMINPVIIARSKRKITLWDDCFSFPDILVRLKRNAKIVVRYFDVIGKERKIEAANSLSELLQHEIDHLDGVLTIDHALNTRDIILRKEWERRYKKP